MYKNTHTLYSTTKQAFHFLVEDEIDVNIFSHFLFVFYMRCAICDVYIRLYFFLIFYLYVYNFLATCA